MAMSSMKGFVQPFIRMSRSFDNKKLVQIREGSFDEKYEKIKLLGEGADGQTFLVRKREGGLEFVAKEAHAIEPKTGNAKDERTESQRKFLEEFEKLRSFQHPNILKVFELLIDEAQDMKIFTITDLARGGDLQHFASVAEAHGVKTETWAANVFRQAVAGAVFLHSESVVHNDLKPENILVMQRFDPSDPTKVPLVVLTDFGRSTFESEARFSHGDPRYQPPESWTVMMKVFDGDRYVDLDVQAGFKADVWSMGATIYEVVSGKLPFLYEACSLDDFMSDTDTRAHDKLRAAMEGDQEVHIFPGASRPLADLLGQLLSRDPDRRPSMRRTLQHGWFEKDVEKTPNESARRKTLSSTSWTRRNSKGLSHTILLNALSAKLQVDDYQDCAALFVRHDTDGSGRVSMEDFKRAFAAIQEDSTLALSGRTSRNAGAEVELLFHVADVTNSGQINFYQFLSVLTDWSSFDRERLQAYVKILFNHIDRDGTGFITKADLSHAVQGIADESELSAVFQECDSDRDGTISLDELHSFLFDPNPNHVVPLNHRVSRLSQGSVSGTLVARTCWSGCWESVRAFVQPKKRAPDVTKNPYFSKLFASYT